MKDNEQETRDMLARCIMMDSTSLSKAHGVSDAATEAFEVTATPAKPFV